MKFFYFSVTTIFLFFFIPFSSFGQSATFSATLHLTNPSDAIDDVNGKVEVFGGEAPYIYIWDQREISIYENQSDGLPEGETIYVKVVDAKNDTAYAQAEVEAGSFAEKANKFAKPAVEFLQRLLFASIWSDTVNVDRYDLIAPNAIKHKSHDYILEKWLVKEGTEVKHMEPVAILSDDGREFEFYAIGSGKLEYGIKENGEKVGSGDAVTRINRRGNETDRVLGQVVYPSPEPYLYNNLSTRSQGVPLIVAWLFIGALFFTLRMKFPQIKGFKHAVLLIRGVYDNPKKDVGEVSHFQALVTALSATIGLGNIAGVAIAISMGGPGASFWIIVAGLLGMASKFVECQLAVKYRKRNKLTGEISGGPMYYLKEGLARRGKGFKKLGIILATLFSILCIGASFGGGNMFQANQAFQQLTRIPGWEGLENYSLFFGLGLALLVGVVIIGGIRSIARVTDKIVPLMVIVYMLSGLVIMGANWDNLGAGFQTIFSGAFHADAIYGGFIGVLIMGLQRATFSNEAGVGSAPIAHSAVKTDEPVSEGVVGLLEPFVDTVVVCTMTALIIIFSGYAVDPEGLSGSSLTTAAFSSVLGDWMIYVLSFAVLLFAFSTMISWSYYGQKAFTFLFGDSKLSANIYRVIFLIFVVIGSTVGLGSVLDFSDLMILGMAFPNIAGLLIMSGEVRRDVKDYFRRVKSGEIKRYK